jgi:hypothetical protein
VIYTKQNNNIFIKKNIMNPKINKIKHIQESNKILEKRLINENEEVDEGLFSGVRDAYNGLKGVWRGYGYDFSKHASSLRGLVRRLRKLDEPNAGVMTELSELRAKVDASSMPPERKQELLNNIDGAISNFNNYSSYIVNIENITNNILN